MLAMVILLVALFPIRGMAAMDEQELIEKSIKQNKIIMMNIEPQVTIPLQTDTKSGSASDTKSSSTSTSNKGTYIGKFRVSHYCPCAKCNGKSGARTASGVFPKVGVTIAASKSFKFGTKLYLNGIGTRVVQDRGGAITGNKIDLFVGSHKEAMRLGVKYVAVYRQ